MSQLFDPYYLFNLLPGSPNLGFWRAVMIVSVALIVAGVIAIGFVKKNKIDGIRRRLWRRIAIWSLTISIVALIFAFFRFQNAYFLSMRALILLWILFALLWGAWIGKYAIKDMPQRVRAREEERAFKQYLPEKKR